MISNILIYVDDIDHIDDYRKAGVSAFLFALEGYSVGYNTYTLESINNNEVSNKYVMINRVLDCESVDGLKEVLPKLTNVKGIVYEDIAVYNLVKDLGLDLEMIFYQNHFGTNSNSVNFWLDRCRKDMKFLGQDTGEIVINKVKYLLDHPGGGSAQSLSYKPQKRIESLMQNHSTFASEWVDEGKLNIFNSEVLKCKKSSDRVSIIINKDYEHNKIFVLLNQK